MLYSRLNFYAASPTMFTSTALDAICKAVLYQQTADALCDDTTSASAYSGPFPVPKWVG